MIKIDDIDVNKILVSKKEPYGTIKSIKYFNRCNDDDVIRHYVWSFLKWLDMLNALIIITMLIIIIIIMLIIIIVTKQYLSRLLRISYLKSIPKYRKKVSNSLNIKFDSELIYGDSGT